MTIGAAEAGGCGVAALGYAKSGMFQVATL